MPEHDEKVFTAWLGGSLVRTSQADLDALYAGFRYGGKFNPYLGDARLDGGAEAEVAAPETGTAP